MKISDLTWKPLFALSSHPLRSVDYLDHLDPRTRSALAQHRAFVVAGSSFIGNNLLLAIRSKLLIGVSLISS